MMRHVVGVDLGTSSVKVVVLREDGVVIGSAAQAYPLSTPHPGWAEQDPHAWWSAFCSAVRDLLDRVSLPADSIQAMAMGGQMHGLALLDARGDPLCPAIIWPDQRSAEEAEDIERRLAGHDLLRTLGGGVSPGFMLASLAWRRAHQPELWARAATALLPKDYLRYRVTGVLASDPSDGCGIPLIDLSSWAWSTDALEQLDLPAHLLPPLLPSDALAGTVTPAAAEATGLPAGLPVFCGGSDQAMGAIGAGLLEPGPLLLSISTGGQMVTVLTAPPDAPARGLRTLCHALPGRYLALAATLGAGLSLTWLRAQVFADASADASADLLALAATAPPGAGGLLFFPYLAGERMPLLDPQASGAWLGLRLDHGRAHLARAVLEGVVFGLRQALEPLRETAARPSHILLAGGMARAPLAPRVVADVLGQPVRLLRTAEQSALGAALLAAVGVGLFPDLATACAAAVGYEAPLLPDPARADLYDRLYAHYRGFYPKVRDDMHALRRLGHEAATLPPDARL